MDEVPVVLNYEGKRYDGLLSSQSGAGTNVFNLSIKNFYRGSLSFTERRGWVFHTQEGRYDEWALVLGNFVEEAFPARKLKAELPPPFRMLEFVYQASGLKATVEVNSMHGGSYYLQIRNRVVNGHKQPGFDEVYFMRRQAEGEEASWYSTAYSYKELIKTAG